VTDIDTEPDIEPDVLEDDMEDELEYELLELVTDKLELVEVEDEECVVLEDVEVLVT